MKVKQQALLMNETSPEFAPTQSFESYEEEREIINAVARLRWLMGLRWLALIGVSLSAGLAVIGLVPGINLPIMLFGVAVGIGSNLYIQWGLSHRTQVNIESLHVGQALFDTFVLSLVLWSAGGADCPFTSFYVFPVLLSVLLSAKRTFWPTAIASVLGLLWQELSRLIPFLQVGAWNPIEPWGELLSFIAPILTIAMVAYFAARFTEAIREQVKAKRAADELLRLSFERLQAGVELIEGGTTVWQNPFARQALGERRFQHWRCPGHGQGINGDHHDCGVSTLEGGLRCRFSLEQASQSSLQMQQTRPEELSAIYEVMLLSPPDMKQKVAIYIDQTSEIIYQRKLMNTERLASLGRTAQGVAHELNTPLATIQTLGRDLLDVIKSEWTQATQEDAQESAQIILEEVQRCSRITHALLGKSDNQVISSSKHPQNSHSQNSHSQNPQVNSLAYIIKRAIALVFPNGSKMINLNLNELDTLKYPSDPLIQIFVNLIQNAYDATVEAELLHSDQQNNNYLAKIEVIAHKTEEFINLFVIDQGVGISVESGLLFEPFYTTKSIGQGTGLGLYTSYALAKELNGELSIANNDKGGATVTLSLPLHFESTLTL